MTHFGNGKDTEERVEKFCRLEQAHESQAVTFWVKALKADLKNASLNMLLKRVIWISLDMQSDTPAYSFQSGQFR